MLVFLLLKYYCNYYYHNWNCYNLQHSTTNITNSAGTAATVGIADTVHPNITASSTTSTFTIAYTAATF